MYRTFVSNFKLPGLSLFFMSASYLCSAQATLNVFSKNDQRLTLYNDSLKAYTVGKEVAYKLAELFEQLTNTKDYSNYFTAAWQKQYNYGDPIDTTLGYSEYLPVSEHPNSTINNFASNTAIGKLIQTEIARLDSLHVMPKGKIVGAELPVTYVYEKPSREVVLVQLEKTPVKPTCFTSIERTTHFLVDDKGRTVRPYNIKKYYVNGKVVKQEYVSPLNHNEIIEKTSSGLQQTLIEISD